MTTGEKPANTRAMFAVLCTATAAYALLQSLVLPVLPVLQAGLHTSQNTVTWVLTAYLLSASIFTPIMGRLGDMFGKERMLVLALAALAIGSLISAIAPSIGVMIIGRAIQGVGGGVLPLAFGIIRDEYPQEKVAGAVGVIAGLAAAGSAIGVVIAGPIVDALDYHWLFWIPMIALVIAGVAAHFVVPRSANLAPGKLNWPAALVLSAWLVALLLAVSEAPTWGWGSPKVIGLIVLGLVIAAGWIVLETKSEQPLIDMRMMRIPVVWTTNLVAFLFGVGLYATFAFVPEFVQTASSHGYGFGYSITQSGLVILPMGLAMFVFSFAAGSLTSRYGAKSLLLVGSGISIVTFILLTFVSGQQWVFFVAMAIQGVGFGLAFAAMSTLIVEGVPHNQTGVASGMNANIRTIGGSLGAAVVSSIIAATSHHGSLPTKTGYTHGFGLLAITTIAATVAAVFVPTVKKHLSKEELHDALPHAELGLVAAGTLFGDDPE